MGTHILEIIVMLLVAAILGFLIAWFLKKNKIEEMKAYIAALEEKNSRMQVDFRKNEQLLIECQTRRAQKEKSLKECEEEIQRLKQELLEKEKKEHVEAQVHTTQPDKKPEEIKDDDFTIIEGIGPKISSILKNVGITSFEDLSGLAKERILEILIEAEGTSYNRFDPGTWPQQAKLAAENKMEELREWQDKLKGGKVV